MQQVRQHTDIWLVRHTQTDWNRQRRYQSRSDRPLSDFGQSQAQAVAAALRKHSLDAIVTSDQQRSNQLAQLVSQQQRRPAALSHDQRWREVDHGAWEGLTYNEVLARYPEQARSRHADSWESRAHGGEALADLWLRVEAAWGALLTRYDGQRILLVSHATPIQLLLCGLLGIDPRRHWQLRVDHGGMTNLDLYPAGAIVRMLNYLPPYQKATPQRD